ncbi:MAG: rane protein [Thermoleophilia bacterium]|nr:rane protein [Thermoleophilia bacterium]
MNRRVLAATGCVLVACALLIATLVAMFGHPPIDDALVADMHEWRDGPLGELFVWATRIGNFGVVAPLIAGLVLVLLALRRIGAAALLGCATAAVAILNPLTKNVFDRARPNLDPEFALTSFSMPSGHASSSAAFAFALLLGTRTRRERIVVGTIAVAFTLIVGLSRPVLGAHWPSDVLAGWAEGAGIAFLLAAWLVPWRAEAQADMHVTD